MKITDYVVKRMVVGTVGVWGLTVLLSWTLMHFLVGPKVFTVADQEEPVDLATGGSMLSLLLAGFLSVCGGLALMIVATLGCILLLILLQIAPLLAIFLRVWAYCKFKAEQRRYKKKLREAERAREGM